MLCRDVVMKCRDVFVASLVLVLNADRANLIKLTTLTDSSNIPQFVW